jgi:hypothetical protein
LVDIDVLSEFLRGESLSEWIAANNPNKQPTLVGAGYHWCEDIEDGKEDTNSVARAIA